MLLASSASHSDNDIDIDSAERYQLNVQSQTVEQALRSLANASSRQLLFPYDQMEALKSVSISGRYTLKEALGIILKDTSLSGELTTEGVILVTPIQKKSDRGSEMKNRKNLLASTIAFFVGAGGVPMVVGQDDGGASEQWVLEEVVVTASRRDQKLQDVSMAISVIDPSELAVAGLTGLSDVIAYTPGVSINASVGDPIQKVITIRGVRDSVRNATVGTYLDGVPLTSNGPHGNGAFVPFDGLLGDIERVEFLKGPQGTLYGSTSIGGAIKYVTRKPSLDVMKGYASTSVSSTSQGGLNHIHSARISAPMIEDRLGFTLAGYYEDNGGFVDRVEAGTGNLLKEDADGYDKFGISADVYYVFSDNLNFRGKAVHQSLEFHGLSVVDIDPVTVKAISDPFSDTSLYSDSGLEHTIYSGTVEYQFEGAKLTFVSSYIDELRDARSDSMESLGGADIVDMFYVGRPTGTTTSVPSVFSSGSERYTQEIQLVSDSSETWEWITGLYYTDETTFRNNDLSVQPGDVSLVFFEKPSEYTEIAAFGNLTYYLTPELDLTIGARFSSNEMRFDDDSSSDVGFGSADFTSKVDDTVTTWSLSARYRPQEELSLYARAANGYRPAFANSQSFFDPEGKVSDFVEADTLLSYEVGAKGSFAEIFNYDVALWYLTWNDFQALVSLPGVGEGASNVAGGITGKGIEGSLTASPLKGLSIVTSFSYTESTLNDDEPSIDGLAGQQLPNVPEWQFSSRINYDFTLGSNTEAMIGLGVRYEGNSRSGFTDGGAFIPGVSDPLAGPYDVLFNIESESYVLVDLNAGLTWDQVSLNVFVTNLLNEYTITGTLGRFFGVPVSTGIPTRPRTAGAQLSFNF